MAFEDRRLKSPGSQASRLISQHFGAEQSALVLSCGLLIASDFYASNRNPNLLEH
jgi:hypothetical protein